MHSPLASYFFIPSGVGDGLNTTQSGPTAALVINRRHLKL